MIRLECCIVKFNDLDWLEFGLCYSGIRVSHFAVQSGEGKRYDGCICSPATNTGETLSQPYDVKITLYEDWAGWLGDELKALGYNLDPNFSSQDVAMAYFNVMQRRIPAAPRRFELSSDFSCPPEVQAGFDWLREKSERGDDLNGHASRGITKANKFDPLLFDWGIHHFHLGTTLEANGLVQGTKLVLLAIVQGAMIYCINIRPHGNSNPMLWAERELLEIVHSNWPDLIRQFKSDFTDVTPKLNDEQYFTMREAGANAFLELKDGTVYLSPGGGFMLAGNSFSALTAHDRSASQFYELKAQIESKIDVLVEKIRTSTPYTDSKFHFGLDRLDKDCFVREWYSGAVIAVD
jgi:hypothetical protein